MNKQARFVALFIMLTLVLTLVGCGAPAKPTTPEAQRADDVHRRRRTAGLGHRAGV